MILGILEKESGSDVIADILLFTWRRLEDVDYVMVFVCKMELKFIFLLLSCSLCHTLVSNS